MDTGEAMRMARELLDRHGLADWEVVLDRAVRRAGVCRPAVRQIGLSGPLAELHSRSQVRDTVLHEVAHALVGAGHGHDEVWRATAVRIGCSGRRCTDPDAPVVEGDWVGTCPAGHRVTRHRRPARPGSCRQCSSVFSPDHLLAWTHRGAEVPMGPAYEAQLARVRDRGAQLAVAAARPARAPRVGQRARVVAPGRHHGVEGVVVKRARTRFHLQVPGALLTVPFGLLEAVDA